MSRVTGTLIKRFVRAWASAWSLILLFYCSSIRLVESYVSALIASQSSWIWLYWFLIFLLSMLKCGVLSPVGPIPDIIFPVWFFLLMMCILFVFILFNSLLTLFFKICFFAGFSYSVAEFFFSEFLNCWFPDPLSWLFLLCYFFLSGSWLNLSVVCILFNFWNPHLAFCLFWCLWCQ